MFEKMKELSMSICLLGLLIYILAIELKFWYTVCCVKCIV